MKFKVGDKVRVKSLAEIKEISEVKDDCYITYYEHNTYCVFNTPYMKNFCGKVFTIKKVLDLGRYSFLEEETKSFVFIDAWLEPSIKPIYVSSFDEDAEIVETEETKTVVETLRKEQFIEKILDLEPSIEQCIETDCEECNSFCIVRKMKIIIQSYKENFDE